MQSDAFISPQPQAPNIVMMSVQGHIVLPPLHQSHRNNWLSEETVNFANFPRDMGVCTTLLTRGSFEVLFCTDSAWAEMPLHALLPRRWTAFPTRGFATAAERPRIPQTVIEKVVQKYAVGLPVDKVVKAGDYVMIRPEHVMTHDNTGPVVSK